MRKKEFTDILPHNTYKKIFFRGYTILAKSILNKLKKIAYNDNIEEFIKDIWSHDKRDLNVKHFFFLIWKNKYIVNE